MCVRARQTAAGGGGVGGAGVGGSIVSWQEVGKWKACMFMCSVHVHVLCRYSYGVTSRPAAPAPSLLCDSLTHNLKALTALLRVLPAAPGVYAPAPACAAAAPVLVGVYRAC